MITLPRKLYDWLIQHPLIGTFIITIPSHLFIFAKNFGVQFGMVNNVGNFKGFWVYFFMFLWITSFLFVLLKSYADKYNEDSKASGQAVLRSLLQSLNAITIKKCNRFTEYIDTKLPNSKNNPFIDITQPKLQIDCIIDNIQMSFAELFGINRDDIGLSLFWYSTRDVKWVWLKTLNTATNIRLQDLIKNQESTAYQITSGGASSVFFPDKKVGLLNKQYIEGKKDKQYNSTGSIIARELTIGESNQVRAVLSITTYGKQLCDENDQNAILRIENEILPTFEKRLKLELALLYIRECYETPYRKNSPFPAVTA
jgi:hypothetical protein